VKPLNAFGAGGIEINKIAEIVALTVIAHTLLSAVYDGVSKMVPDHLKIRETNLGKLTHDFAIPAVAQFGREALTIGVQSISGVQRGTQTDWMDSIMKAAAFGGIAALEKALPENTVTKIVVSYHVSQSTPCLARIPLQVLLKTFISILAAYNSQKLLQHAP